MARQIGGFSVEARYFIVEVPEGWKETDPLPEPSPDDRWFDSVTEFKAALDGPWIRRPIRRNVWKKTRRAARPAAATPPTLPSMSTMAEPSIVAGASSPSSGDRTESEGGLREIAAQIGPQESL